MIDKIIFKLAELFPKVNFDIDEVTFGDNVLFQIEVDDYEFYMFDKTFEKWLKILRTKYPKVKWFVVYKNPIKNPKK